MVAVGDEVAVIEDAERADACLGPAGGSTDRTMRREETPRGRPYTRTACRRRYGLLAVWLGCPAFSGLLILRPFNRRDGRLYTQANLAAPIDQTWQSMLLSPAAN